MMTQDGKTRYQIWKNMIGRNSLNRYALYREGTALEDDLITYGNVLVAEFWAESSYQAIKIHNFFQDTK